MQSEKHDSKRNNEKAKLTRFGNVYGDQFGTGYAGNVWDTDGLCPTLQTMQGGGRQPMIIVKKKIDNMENEYMVRKLTPRECWRLQGFPDYAFDKAQNAGVSNTQLYKQAGNSISTCTIYYVFKNLYLAMPYLFENLKLSSFFSGIGAFELALDMLYEDINSGNINSDDDRFKNPCEILICTK